MALLVLLVLPSAQIKLGASQLNGLIGSYTSGGHLWQVSYSSTGTTTWHTIGSDGTAQQGSRQWPATGSGDGFQDSTRLDGTTSGTVTATLTWVPSTGQDNTTDPPSSSVIVTESGSARWGGGLGTGNADDGWGDPVQYAASSGVHYEVKDGSSGTITITKSLSASTPPNTTPNGHGGFDRIGAFVAASLSVAGDSATITLDGTTLDSNGKLNILVGQGCTASLNTPPFSVQQQSGWTWTIPGITFQSWNGDSGTVPVTADTGPGLTNQRTAHWYWNDTAGLKTVTCTATVTPPSGQGSPFTLTVTQQVNLQTPTWTASNHGGLGYIVDVSSIYKLEALPSPLMLNQGFSEGSTWHTTVSTPPLFSTGQFSYAQIITSGEYLTPYGGTEQASPETGQTELDTMFPYQIYSADGMAHDEGDSPRIPLNTLQSSPDLMGYVRLTDTFKTYLMFRPGTGDTQWVPLAESDWHLNMGTYRPLTRHWSDFPPNQSVGGVYIDSDFTPQPTHPSWDHVSAPPH